MSFIDFTHFTAAKNSFEANPGLCNLFKFLSIETWKRIEFTYIKPRIKVYETTLTQNIAFATNAYVDFYPMLNIRVFEAENEKANGNDIELIIRFKNFDYDFYAAIQAKKIYRNNGYNAMDHGDQIVNLINYASDATRNAWPLYLLYNYIDPIPTSINNDNELYGCSIVDAQYLRDNYYNKRIVNKRDGTSELKWLIPFFNDLHPTHAFPWHQLVCDLSPITLLARLLRISDIQTKRNINIALLLQDSMISNWGSIPGFVRKGSISDTGWRRADDKSLMTIDQIKNIEIPSTEESGLDIYRDDQRLQKQSNELLFIPKNRLEIFIE